MDTCFTPYIITLYRHSVYLPTSYKNLNLEGKLGVVILLEE